MPLNSGDPSEDRTRRYLFLAGDGTWQLSLNVAMACTPQSVARLD